MHCTLMDPKIKKSNGAGLKPAPEAVNWSLLAIARFLLALSVVQFHIFIFFDRNVVSALIAMFGGKSAVIGFLVISGFSIRASLIRKPDHFIVRRLLRIYPVYFLALAASLYLQFSFQAYHTPFHTFINDSLLINVCNVLLLQMYACKAIDYNLAVWSLSIEFSYYIFAHLMRDRISDRLLIAIALVSVALYMMPAEIDHSSLYALLVKFKPTKYIWAFLFGYILYTNRHMLIFVSFALLGAFAVMHSPETSDADLGWVTVFSTVVIIWIATRFGTRRIGLLEFVGDISYPLYLLHLPVMIALSGFFGISDPKIFMLATTLTAILAVNFVEAYFRKRMHRLGSLRV